MNRMLSVTEAHSQLPTLVKEVVEQGSPVIISVQNQPKAVIMGYEMYVSQQELVKLGAKYEEYLLANGCDALHDEYLGNMMPVKLADSGPSCERLS